MGDSAWKEYPSVCLEQAAESSRNMGREIAEAGRRVSGCEGTSPFRAWRRA